MKKAFEHIAIIVCIVLFLAVIGFADGLSKAEPPNGVETAVSTSTADKPSEPAKATYVQPQYEPYIDNYVNRIPEDSQNVEVPEEQIIAVAKMMYGECNSSWIPIEEKAAVCWVVCNRVDSEDPYFPDTIVEVVTQKGGFYGYKESNPVTDELYDIALDVLTRWHGEKSGMGYVGRVIPSDFLWFTGDGTKNIFRDAYRQPYQEWDFSWESPYEH